MCQFMISEENNKEGGEPDRWVTVPPWVQTVAMVYDYEGEDCECYQERMDDAPKPKLRIVKDD